MSFILVYCIVWFLMILFQGLYDSKVKKVINIFKKNEDNTTFIMSNEWQDIANEKFYKRNQLKYDLLLEKGLIQPNQYTNILKVAKKSLWYLFIVLTIAIVVMTFI